MEGGKLADQVCYKIKKLKKKSPTSDLLRLKMLLAVDSSCYRQDSGRERANGRGPDHRQLHIMESFT